MDLTILLEGVTLNIRVAVIMKTAKGYIFEKNPKGYLFTLGGRVKSGESSFEAAQREVQEELGFKMEEAKLTAIVENFFGPTDAQVHEICFVYRYEATVTIALSNEFIEVSEGALPAEDIRPEVIKTIITNKEDTLTHIIVK